MKYHLMRQTETSQCQMQRSASKPGIMSLLTRQAKKSQKKLLLIGFILICLGTVFGAGLSLQAGLSLLAQNSAFEPAPITLTLNYQGDAWKLMQQQGK